METAPLASLTEVTAPPVPRIEVDDLDLALLRALATDWVERVEDYDLVCSGDRLRRAIESAGATLIGFRRLRDLARQS